ncbi:RNA-binding S4 domain-containing protein [Pseudohoeflea coraliihabitans]|uniref:RNA-binding S4 domain-containing protein n=1 Tax=Pseudohoeflea coraliihabitans TaxID=2860393 RepID=UPI003204B6F7
MATPAASPERQRLDKWLFFARIIKSRTLAAKSVEAGRVRVNGEKKSQPSFMVRAGDVLTIVLERRVLVLKILDCGSSRGPASEARTLYEDLSPPIAASDRANRAMPSGQRDAGSGRPTKRQRRQTDRLKFPDHREN